MKDKLWARVLRVAGIVLMGITAIFTLMGGAGTSCVAISPTGFGGKFAGIAPFQWLYILFVVVTFAFGVMGARAVLLLIRNRANSYRYSVIALAGGTVVGVIHMLVSRNLRGSSMPVDMVTYINILTLIVFLIFRIPGLWQQIGYGRPVQTNPAGMAGGLTSITCGAISLTIQYWMGPTHTIGGVNFADIWHVQLEVIGWFLVTAGVFALLWSVGVFSKEDTTTRMVEALE
jgi:hypothetical protein